VKFNIDERCDVVILRKLETAQRPGFSLFALAKTGRELERVRLAVFCPMPNGTTAHGLDFKLAAPSGERPLSDHASKGKAACPIEGLIEPPPNRVILRGNTKDLPEVFPNPHREQFAKRPVQLLRVFSSEQLCNGGQK